MSTCRRRIVGVEDCFITPIGFWKGQGILPVHHKDDKLVTLNHPIDESSSSTQPKYTPLKVFFFQLLMPLITAYPPNRHLL
ncbi:hypothetical protein D917_03491 [Trichinella nativa]|uniref:Uncharacterized protein n=1 Tax=Trichinella nativa TaxID=6335 RepID=A0A1Y3E835_9BILA|nr:hypothetical protein D917_03491 [Trichinella nativa]